MRTWAWVASGLCTTTARKPSPGGSAENCSGCRCAGPGQEACHCASFSRRTASSCCGSSWPTTAKRPPLCWYRVAWKPRASSGRNVSTSRRQPARAAPQQIDGELREPCLSPRVLAGAGRHRESGVEERKAPLLQGEKRQARGQFLDRQRRQGHVGGHFSTSPGIRVTTLRR